MLKPGIVISNLTLSYQRHPAVHHLSGHFEEGSLTAIMGPNGGGKSTLIKALAGLHAIDEGRIDRSSTHTLQNTAYLPQSNNWDRQIPLNVFELASQALLPELGFWKRPNSEQTDRVLSALEQVGLKEEMKRSIASLSLGQFQRALFARVIVQNSQVILLDEPLTGLDEKSIDACFELIHQWHQECRTVVVVLHDRHLAIKHFPRTLILAREAQAWGPTSEVLEPNFWRQALVKKSPSRADEECLR